MLFSIKDNCSFPREDKFEEIGARAGTFDFIITVGVSNADLVNGNRGFFLIGWEVPYVLINNFFSHVIFALFSKNKKNYNFIHLYANN